MVPHELASVSGGEDELATLKSQFLATLNHEIRTPLTGIFGMTDLLLETPLSDEQKDYLTTIRQCAEELLGLLNKTLGYSEVSSGGVRLVCEPFHLPEAVRNAVAEYMARARARGLLLNCRLAAGMPQAVLGDAVRLRQVISELVDNAIKFTERGSVEVSAGGESAAGKYTLRLSVRDSGIGIPADLLPHICESFRQLDAGLAKRHSGLGLGLSLAQGLVRLMGGEMSVESEPGRGSVFQISVPLDLPADGALRGPAGRVLLVEDDEVARRIVVHILGRQGYMVRCARSGPEAVEMAAGDEFDAVLMDLQMPGMDGFQTASRIRRMAGYGRVPIIALTANTSDEYRRLCLAGGMRGFVPKPVQAQELLGALSSVLR